MRKAPRSSTVHLRAIVAATLALGLIAAVAAIAWAAPSLTIDSGPSGPTADTMPTFGFTADAGTTVECSIDQGTPVYGPCSGASTHAPDAPLADGDWFFRVRATDASLEQTEASQAFTVDTAPPSLSIDSGPAGPTNVAAPTFGFTAEANARLECSIDGGLPAYGPCSGPDSHTPDSPLGDGSYTFRVRATDAAGNVTTLTRSFTVDVTPPSLSIDSGPAGPTNDTTPTFGFTAEPGATVACSIDQGSPAYGSCASATTHQPLAPLGDGSYTFRVRATDAVGNVTTLTQAFSVDSSAPSLSIDSGPAGPTNDTTPTFGFTAAAGATVECSVDQGTAAYRPCTSATTHAVGTPLAEGRYTFRVRATNALGTHAISARSFTVDTTPPSLSIGFGPSGTTSDSTPLFGFTAEAGATLECSIDQGTPAYGSCASATTHAVAAPLADGAYVFRVRATDAASNQATATRAFTVDTVPQTQPGGTTTDPTPPATTTTTTTSAPQLLSPFPLVRISGTLTASGARIRLLSVRASPGTLVRVTVSPACAKRHPTSRRCRVVQASGTVGRRAVIAFGALARPYRSGTVIVVRAWRADRIGKYTRFTIVRGKAPRRVDQCLAPGATRGSRCPSD